MKQAIKKLKNVLKVKRYKVLKKYKDSGWIEVSIFKTRYEALEKIDNSPKTTRVFRSREYTKRKNSKSKYYAPKNKSIKVKVKYKIEEVSVYFFSLKGY